jgi:hypothetical protein
MFGLNWLRRFATASALLCFLLLPFVPIARAASIAINAPTAITFVEGESRDVAAVNSERLVRASPILEVRAFRLCSESACLH